MNIEHPNFSKLHEDYHLPTPPRQQMTINIPSLVDVNPYKVGEVTEIYGKQVSVVSSKASQSLKERTTTFELTVEKI